MSITTVLRTFDFGGLKILIFYILTTSVEAVIVYAVDSTINRNQFKS